MQVKICAEGIGKKFGREWIFKNFNFEFSAGKKYAITGRNGSGKSTLLKILASAEPLTEGTLTYASANGTPIAIEHIYQHLSYSAPYLELIEELTLSEFIDFYTKFKSLKITSQEFIERLNFKKAKNKHVRNFSSGMKQRLQLGLALFSYSSIIFLDEPTSNLDHYTIDWYLQTVQEVFEKQQILIISSNQPAEYSFCDEILAIESFKQNQKV